MPGQNIEGEGVLLEIPGFIVDIVSPTTAPADEPLPVRAKVTMTCGCPTEPGGMWNADKIAISARAIRDGKVAGEMPLRYAGETSTYEASFAALEPGTYDIEVLAIDAGAANFGRAVQHVVVPPRAAR